jgi:hypothetical protein
MKTDRTTKLLLAVIAAGLWLNVTAALIRPTPAKAQDAVESLIREMEIHLRWIANGNCSNRKIC